MERERSLVLQKKNKREKKQGFFQFENQILVMGCVCSARRNLGNVDDSVHVAIERDKRRAGINKTDDGVDGYKPRASHPLLDDDVVIMNSKQHPDNDGDDGILDDINDFVEPEMSRCNYGPRSSSSSTRHTAVIAMEEDDD